MTKSDCKGCRYFDLQQNQTLGACRRYPTYQNRHQNEWCGEFVAKITSGVGPSEDFLYKEMALPVEPIVPEIRRGRPPKLSRRQVA